MDGLPFSFLRMEISSKVMSPRWTGSLLMLLMMILLKFIEDIWMLPEILSVSMESVNMRHTLRWTPLQASCNSTVLYSIQYQGEFELMLRNGSWVDAADCQQISHTYCDLTSDLGSDSDYNVRVRAQCGMHILAWTKLGRPFNRKETVLTVPEMTITTAGNTLRVSFKDLPLPATVWVKVWKKDEESQAVVYRMPAEQKVLPVTALQEGGLYCVQAQLFLASGIHSSSTEPHCEHITGPESVAAWKKPTTVTVTVLVTAGLLFALFWSIIHCPPHACQVYFQKEPLPPSLDGGWDIIIPTSPRELELPFQLISIDQEQRTYFTQASLTALLEDKNRVNSHENEQLSDWSENV